MVTAAMGQLPSAGRCLSHGVRHRLGGVRGRHVEGQAAFNRPAITHLLGTEWLPGVPDLDERLRSDPPARIADVGCGEGWSSIAIAQAYLMARVVGIDLDAPSIDAGREHAETAGEQPRGAAAR